MKCERCLRESATCICSLAVPVETRTRVLILQHPKEQDETLGTGRLAHLSLPNSILRIGLSWKNLGAALARAVDPKRWAVLYLGSVGISVGGLDQPLVFVDRKGTPLSKQREIQKQIEGIVVLDGTWSQGKALWWRNPWLLKLHRAVLVPEKPSLYGNLRKQPRRDCLSTIEALALCLSVLEGKNARPELLLESFRRLLRNIRR